MKLPSHEQRQLWRYIDGHAKNTFLKMPQKGAEEGRLLNRKISRKLDAYKTTGPLGPSGPIHPSVHPSITYQSLPSYQATNVSNYQPINLPRFPSINLSIYLLIDLSIWQCIDLTAYHSVNLPTYQPINLPINLPRCRFTHLPKFRPIVLSNYQFINRAEIDR